MATLVPLTIAQNADTSSGVDTAQSAPAALLWSAAMTGTDATFEVSVNGSDWYPLHAQDGTPYTVPITPGAYQPLDPVVAYACVGVQVRVVSSANEAAARTLNLLLRSLA